MTSEEMIVIEEVIQIVDFVEQGIRRVVNAAIGLVERIVESAKERRESDIDFFIPEVGSGIKNNRESLLGVTGIASPEVAVNEGRQNVESIKVGVHGFDEF